MPATTTCAERVDQCKKPGIAVPDRLSTAGIDNAPTSLAAWPQLTTIRQPKGEMAAAVDILVNLQSAAHPTDVRFRRLLNYELIVRPSTGAK